jgi:hypothetical protein
MNHGKNSLRLLLRAASLWILLFTPVNKKTAKNFNEKFQEVKICCFFVDCEFLYFIV